MPRVEAERELLAPRRDVWAFLAEPHHLPDWWPGLASVEPDRRGLSEGARWQVRAADRPSLLHRSRAPGMLLVRRVEEPSLVAWHLTADRVDVELRLEAVSAHRTRAILIVSSPSLVGFGRSLPRKALSRLHALCQTAAEL
ncbi:MAG: SRPBCC family protein [Gaiellaceae bacterium]